MALIDVMKIALTPGSRRIKEYEEAAHICHHQRPASGAGHLEGEGGQNNIRTETNKKPRNDDSAVVLEPGSNALEEEKSSAEEGRQSEPASFIGKALRWVPGVGEWSEETSAKSQDGSPMTMSWLSLLLLPRLEGATSPTTEEEAHQHMEEESNILLRTLFFPLLLLGSWGANDEEEQKQNPHARSLSLQHPTPAGLERSSSGGGSGSGSNTEKAYVGKKRGKSDATPRAERSQKGEAGKSQNFAKELTEMKQVYPNAQDSDLLRILKSYNGKVSQHIRL